MFWCLYCGEKGNAIDFLRRYRKLTQDESIRFLAKNIP
ncbi:MAG: CHC2 zinc finger domain-containing protein [Tannerellaceae bacterium]|nr:CHC2 zinc finger domain-containing protein [Tannerellaceae bacterium]